MTRGRGEVRWGPAIHKPGRAYRPRVIISDPSHPFAETECIALAMTTRAHRDGIEVSDQAWVRGGSDTTASSSPWYVTTVKHADFDRQQGELAADAVDNAVEALHRYTPVSSPAQQ